ncbi:MAG: hypothetical protein IKF83_02625, partial [Clostridia bacterium]|nr:hypothetical protein [Clostridia bacterium]
VDIKEAQTEVEVKLNSEEWTNEKQNEVTFEVKLNSNGAKYNMYKNPSIRMELPGEVEKVILGESSLLYGNGLELQEVKLEENENGSKAIVAIITGTQTQYIENNLDIETYLQIPAVVILKKDLSVDTSKIKVNCSNGYTVDNTIEEKGFEKEIKLESYKDSEQNQETTSDDNQIFSQINSQAIVVDNTEQSINNNLNLEVVPTKGEKVLNDGDIVYEGEFIKYNIKVTNTSDKDIENVKVVTTIPEGVTYGELEAEYFKVTGKYEYNYDENIREKTIDIGTVKANKSITNYYEVKVNNLFEETESKQIQTEIKLYNNNVENKTYTIKNIINPSDVQIFMGAFLDGEKDAWDYDIKINSKENKKANVTFKLPENFDTQYIFDRNKKETVYDLSEEKNNIITVDLESNSNYVLRGKFNYEKILENIDTSKNPDIWINAYAQINDNEKIYNSNETRILFSYDNVSITVSSSNEGETVKYGDKINYDIKVKNIRKTNIDDTSYSSLSLRVTDFLPKDVNPVSLTYTPWVGEKTDVKYETDENGEQIETSYLLTGNYYEGETITEDISNIIEDENEQDLANVDLNILVPYEKEVIIHVETTAGFVTEKTKIENNATISGYLISAKTSNSVTHNILPFNYEESQKEDEPEDKDNKGEQDKKDDPDDEKNDENKENTNTKENYSLSGIAWIDENEDGERQSNEALLRNVEAMLVDLNNSQAIKEKTQTDSNGKYNFNNIQEGNYVVIFKYDTNLYRITEYKKSGVQQDLNCDFVEDTITINQKQEKVGVTDSINVKSNITNIDIGLIKNKQKELKIEKYINKVTVTTNKGKNEINYNDKKLVKTEIRAKEIDGAEVKVLYRIVVTNNGDSKTNIGNIIENIPNGFEFSGTLNSNWVRYTDTKLINTSAKNYSLESGESAEFFITLKKQMTSDTTGTFKNVVELDNMNSSAELIISVSTGMITYVIIAVAILIGLLFTLLIFKFGIKNVTKISMFLLIVSLTIFQIGIKDVFAVDARFRWHGYISKNIGDYTFDKDTSEKAHCTEQNGKICHGVCDAPQSNIYAVDFVGYFIKSIQNKDTKTSGKKPTITLTKENKKDIQMNISGQNYVFGPFKVSCSEKNATYKTEVYKSDGKTKMSTKNYTITGDKNSFYINIPISNFEGISRVKTTASKKMKNPVKTQIYGKVTYEPDRGHTTCQIIQTDGTILVDTEEPDPEYVTPKASVEWTKFDLLGSLDILKKDADSNKGLPNVTINVKCDAVNYNKDHKTDANGKIHIDNLEPGTYTLKETSNLGYGYDGNATGSVTVKAGETASATLTNQKETGKLIIEKKDKDNSNIKLAGVQFKLKKDGSYVKLNGASSLTGTQTITAETNANANGSDATILITDANGRIELNDILTGSYSLEEISVSNNYYELDGNYIYNGNDKVGNDANGKPNSIPISITRNNTSTVNVNNRRKYVDLSGYVWEDGLIGGKGSGYDYKRGTNAKDYDLQGIIVRLKEKVENGNDIIVRTEVTKEIEEQNGEKQHGKYKFEKIEIDKLNNYYIEFEYDGLIYTTGKTFKEIQGESNQTSKAIETNAERTSLNNHYQEVTAGNQKDEGKATKKDNSAFNIKYNTHPEQTGENYVEAYSEYENYTKFNNLTKKGQNYKNVSEMYSYSNYAEINKITANTNDTAYKVLGTGTITNNGDGAETENSIRQNQITELKNRNCCLIQREQVDLSISNDIDNVKVSVNGYTNTYKYGASTAYKDPDKWLKNFRLDVKQNKYGYTRPLYPSDILKDGNDTCKVWITYKITVRNNSNSVSAKVGKLTNYYDARYTLTASGTTTELKGDVAWSESTGKGGYNAIKTDSIKDYTINAGENKEIYVQYELDKSAVLDVLKGYYTLENIVEIGAYTTLQGENIYASIDKNSAPDNVEISRSENNSTIISQAEDDTAKSPTLTMQLTEAERTITGRVFEDKTADGTTENETRLGDGEYKEEDGKVQGVKVELLYFDEANTEKHLQPAKLYKYQQSDNSTYERITDDNAIEAVVTTNEDGIYEFSGILPDKYILRFTYANGNVVYKANSSGTKEIDVNNYKATIITSDVIKQALNNNNIVGDNSTATTNITGTDFASDKWYLIDENNYSDAMDTNETIEKENTVNTINYKNARIATSKEAYSGAMNVQIEFDVNETGTTTDPINTTVDAIQGIEVENTDGTVKYLEKLLKAKTDKIDFGIVQKAKHITDLYKDIENIKITLANGQVIVNGNPANGLNYVKYLPETNNRKAKLNIEIDNELIYGSQMEVTYKITATNKSELNYRTPDYYKYGTPGGENDKETITVSKVIDYLDNNLVIDNISNNNINATKMNETQIMLNGEDINATDYLADDVIQVAKKYNNILILTSVKELKPTENETWSYTASRILATSDSLAFDNDVEEIELKTTPTPSEGTTPGNYNPENPINVEIDNYNSELVITPPTGENRNYNIYIISIASALILIAGIAIIKLKKL